MQTEIVLRNQYFMADSQGKIALILANYVTFPEILEGMEEILDSRSSQTSGCRIPEDQILHRWRRSAAS